MGNAASDGRGGGELLEREREIAQLDSFVSSVERPGPRLGLIEGPAGIGKTSLLREARRLAGESGIRVLTARGSELEREFPYGVVRQLFEPALLDPAIRERAFAGAAASAAAVFEFPGADAATPGGSGFSTLHGLYWLTLELAGDEPLTLLIDDLHWSDSPSLRFLAYVTRRLEDIPIIVVAATRPSEPRADAQLLGEIAADPLTITMSPGPLSEDASGELIESRLGSTPEPAFAAACQETTGGNPMLLGELLSALGDAGVEPVGSQTKLVEDIGPRAVSRAVLLRLGRLSADARAVGRALAILGEGAELWLVAKLAGLDERAAAEATGELRQADILRADPPLGFAHPLVRAAIYADIALGERELEHARAAQLLSDAGARAERIATHLLAVSPRGEAWAAEVLREAGRQSGGRGAADSAAAFFARALAEPPPEADRAGYLIDLGVVQVLTDLRSATPTLREAYRLTSDPDGRALLANLLGRAELFTGEPEAGAAIARETAAALPPGAADQRLGLEALESAIVFFGAGTSDAFERLAAHRRPERVTTLGEKAMAAVVAFEWANANGPRENVAELALASLRDGTLIEADGGLLPMYAIAALWMADREEVMDAWEQMLAAAHRIGSLFGISTIHLWRGFTLYRRGDLPEAEALLREAEESFRLYGYAAGTAAGATADVYVSSVLTLILLARGEAAEARRVFDSATDPGYADSARYWASAKMALLLEEGRDEEVIAAADDFAARLHWIVNPTEAYWRSAKAQALDRLGRSEEAIELLEEELALAREWGSPATVGRVLRVLGTIDRERSIELLEEAVAELERSTTRLELARALYELGTAIRLERRQKEAREPLRRALELAEVCGAAGLVERVRAELGASGSRPRSTALKGVDSLTPSERRVADLAASGMTNKEIAQRLYVIPKTVEVHLSNTYRKLEVRGRRDLSGVLQPAS